MYIPAFHPPNSTFQPPFPAFCFPCPNISSLGSNRRLLNPTYTLSIPTFFFSYPNIPPLGPTFLPPNPAFRHPVPITNPTFPQIQHSTPLMPAFHLSVPQCQHSSPSKPSVFNPCPFNVHIPPSTCNLERAVGPGPVVPVPLASSVSLGELWEIAYVVFDHSCWDLRLQSTFSFRRSHWVSTVIHGVHFWPRVRGI